MTSPILGQNVAQRGCLPFGSPFIAPKKSPIWAVAIIDPR